MPTATPPTTDPFQQMDPWATQQAMAIAAAQAQQAQYAQAAAAASAQIQGDLWQGYRQPHKQMLRAYRAILPATHLVQPPLKLV